MRGRAGAGHWAGSGSGTSGNRFFGLQILEDGFGRGFCLRLAGGLGVGFFGHKMGGALSTQELGNKPCLTRVGGQRQSNLGVRLRTGIKISGTVPEAP